MRTLIVAAAAAAFATSAFAQTAVDLELSLLVDVSGSIDTAEYNLQRAGYAQAFNALAIRNQILSTANGRMGKIAVNMVHWDGSGNQAEVVAWTLLDSNAAIDGFVASLSSVGRGFPGGQTAVGQALNFGRTSVNGNLFDGFRKVMDISSDGDDNVNGVAFTRAARDAAAADGIGINALVIQNNALVTYYQNNVITGTNAFALFSPNFATFRETIETKLRFEIPTPGSLALLGLGGLLAARRRR